MMRALLGIVLLGMVAGCANLEPSGSNDAALAVDGPDIQAARQHCEAHTREFHQGQSFALRRAAMETEIQD